MIIVCIHRKVSTLLIMTLNVDYVLLVVNDISLIHKTKEWLSSKFEMKDKGNACFILGIKIKRDKKKNSKLSIYHKETI